MQYNWHIGQCDHKTADGFITTAHWICAATDGELSTSAYSTCSFGEGTPTIPYADVTEQDVLNWIWSNGVDKSAVEESLSNQIEALRNPVSSQGLPWAVQQEVTT